MSDDRMAVSPYVNFQGRAREAMELHQRLLGGKIELHTGDEAGNRKPARLGDWIAYAQLAADGH